MASTANSIRLLLRTCRQGPVLRVPAQKALVVPRRTLSTTPARWADERGKKDAKKAGEEEEEEEDDVDEYKKYKDTGEYLAHLLANADKDEMSQELRAETARMLALWKDFSPREREEFMRPFQEMHDVLTPLRRPVKPKRDSFWHEDETDPELITSEIGEDEFEEDDMLSMAHGKLEEHREAREYARLTVWEMPLLSRFAKPFEPPAKDQPLRFRYTSYMGEFHAAEKKVVVEFCPNDLPLTEAQQLKLKKLAGVRYNPETEIVKMSCDMFEHQAQNKRYLGDVVDKLIAAARDPTDMFEDIPLDTRHHTVKTKPKFPKEWRMNAERRKQLEAIRTESFLIDQAKREQGLLVDGKKQVVQALAHAAAHPRAPRELVAERVSRSAGHKRGPLRR